MIHPLCKHVWGRNIYLPYLQIQKSLFYVTSLITPPSPSIHPGMNFTLLFLELTLPIRLLTRLVILFLGQTPRCPDLLGDSRPLSPLLRSTSRIIWVRTKYVQGLCNLKEELSNVYIVRSSERVQSFTFYSTLTDKQDLKERKKSDLVPKRAGWQHAKF